MMRKYTGLAAVLIAAAACQDATSPNPIAVTPTSVNAAQNKSNNDYIVTLRDDDPDPVATAMALIKGHNGQLKHMYRQALKGFAVSNLSDADADALMDDPRVAAMERDGLVTVDGSGTQTGATWGIDRIDQRDLPLNQTYNYDADGSGVTAYIIDTGIRITHNEFTGGRARSGFSAINDANGTNDCHGHGTHVAGTVGGSTYGVAQAVSLVAVRVLDCTGSGDDAGVIAGIDYVIQNHNNTGNIAVANMSLGGGFSAALNQAVTNAVNAGITFAVAAGNSNANACNSSPSSAAAALTVGATTNTDAKASFSNFGNCVDINAPGVSITSAWNTSDGATNTISGTSMASPHVAGAAAAFLSANPTATPTAVANALLAAATTGHISGLGATGTPNLLLYTHFSGGSQPPAGPVASISKSCSGFTCTFTSTSTGVSGSTTYDWTRTGGKSATQLDQTHYQVSYDPRTGGTVQLTVTNPGPQSSTATASVTCNPKKCQ